MADDQYCPYKTVGGWNVPEFASDTTNSGVEGSLEWRIRHVTNASGGLETTLSFQPSHRDLEEFVGNWLIEGFLSFSHETNPDVLPPVNFKCNQAHPTHVFDSTVIKGECVVMTVHYTELIGMGVVPRPHYNVATSMTDVCLVVGSDRLHLSKTVLSHYSDYFKAMFFGEFPESTKKEVEIKEVEAEYFIGVLDICFGSHLLKVPHVEKLLEYADRFLMHSAMEKIEVFLLHTDVKVYNIDHVELICLADKYKLIILLTHVVSKLTLTDYGKLMESPSVHQLSRESMVAIMKKVKLLSNK